MTQQPEALRLAECLERDCEMNWPDYDNQMDAAAELRRLNARDKEWESVTGFMQTTAERMEKELLRLTTINAQLLEALEECVEDSQSAVDQYILAYGENFRPHRLNGLREIVSKARAAIAAAKGEA